MRVARYRWLGVVVVLTASGALNAFAQRGDSSEGSGSYIEFRAPKTSARAEVAVRLGEVAIQSAVSETETTSASSAEGDLKGVAEATVLGYIYANNPNVDLVTRDAGGTVEVWNYDVMIDKFGEFRQADGSVGLAVDATIAVRDNNGKTVFEKEFHDPPLDQRMSDEEIEKKIKGKERTGTAVRAIGGLLGNRGGSEVANTVADSQMAAAERLRTNYNTSQPPVKSYQMQEAFVRTAVQDLMKGAPLPGGGGKRAPYRLKDAEDVPKGTPENTFELAQGLFERGELDEAIKEWEGLGLSGNTSVDYNLGVAYLIQAAKLVDGNPSGAAGLANTGAEYIDSAYRAGGKKEVEEELYFGARDYAAALKPFGSGDTGAVTAAGPVGPPGAPSSRYALLIGIGQFEKSSIPPLVGAPHDVDLLAAALSKAGFPAGNIITLKNEQATLQNIKRTMDDIEQKVDENSLLFVSVSTHGSDPGLDVSRAQEGYILCYDSDLDYLFASAYPVLDFRMHIDRRIACKQKILLQDTCHSGAGNQRLSATQITYVQWPPYMAVFAAAQPKQLSLELNGSGVFTSAAAEYIAKNGGRFSVKDMGDYLAKTVPERTAKMNHPQNPVVYLGPGAEEMRLNQ